MKRSIRVALAALAALAFAACNNGNNGNSNNADNCGGPPNNLEVLYPRPNQSRVNPNVTGVWVATNQALPNGNAYNFCMLTSSPVLTPCTSTFGSISYSQLPTGSAKATYPNPQYYYTAFGNPIGPSNSVQLLWNNGGTGCNPNVIVSTFTTGA
jgi:hypothetical protein